jgi:drug/metabolite transporter (DMT)-like permease
MPIWLPITLTAALFQTWRTAKQQSLRHILSVNGAAFVRFFYGAPMAAFILLVAVTVIRRPLPMPTPMFVLWAACGGLTQILATNLLIKAFGFRNFAVGTAYSKTDAAQTAILGWLLLDERLLPLAFIGIGVGLVGVLVLSLGGRGVGVRGLLSAVMQPAAQCGLAAGGIFSFTAIFIKLANEQIAGSAPDAAQTVLCACFVVLISKLSQTIMQGAYLLTFERGELGRAVGAWRQAGLVGVLSACGSACWFSAFALAPVGLVRGVGQVEIVFTLLFSRYYLSERLRRSEVLGLVLVVTGVLLLVMARGVAR